MELPLTPRSSPVIDGHIDLPILSRVARRNNISNIDLYADHAGITELASRFSLDCSLVSNFLAGIAPGHS